MSAVEYTNRKGDKYYLQVGKTRTGKPRYWFGRKLTGEPVESVPAGFEIYEHPQAGLVFLRKTKPSEISPLEREMLSDGIRRYAALEHFIVDVDGDSLVVYLPSMDDRQADRARKRVRRSTIRSPAPDAGGQRGNDPPLRLHEDDAVRSGQCGPTNVRRPAVVLPRQRR